MRQECGVVRRIDRAGAEPRPAAGTRQAEATRKGEPAAGPASPVTDAASRAAPTANVPVITLHGRPKLNRAEWVHRIVHEARLVPGSPEFEPGFARHLTRLLREAGYHATAEAVQATARALVARPGEREEYDALVDAGLTLLVHQPDER